VESEPLDMPTGEIPREMLRELRALREEMAGKGGLRSEVVELRGEVRSAAEANKLWQTNHEGRDDLRFDRLDDREKERAEERRRAEEERKREDEREERTETRRWSMFDKVLAAVVSIGMAAATGGAVTYGVQHTNAIEEKAP
jgi:hypothetical protein